MQLTCYEHSKSIRKSTPIKQSNGDIVLRDIWSFKNVLIGTIPNMAAKMAYRWMETFEIITTTISADLGHDLHPM